MESKNLLIDVDESPKKFYQTFLFALQHVLGVLVGTITAPLLIPGLPIAASMLSAGLGTLFYIFATKKEAPVFLSSNFTYIAPISSAIAVGGIANATGQPANYMAVMMGMVIVGLTYVIIALLIKFTGRAWINKLLPATVVGPTIMIIGLSLSFGGIKNLTMTNNGDPAAYNLMGIACGLVALFVTSFTAHYLKKKMVGLIPFVIGMLAGYVVALLATLIGYTACGNEYFKIIDFQPFIDTFSSENISFASFFNYKMFVPNDKEAFLFLRFEQIKQFDWASIGQLLIIFIPISLVSICEHIGDHKNLGNIINKDLLGKDPGITRTLIGDGLSTTIGGQLCGMANVSYGESIAIIGTTKIASVKVLIYAAIIMCVSSFITPITVLLETIPVCVMGGITLILYGFIAMSGMRVIKQSNINFDKNKNIFIISIILITGIGGFALKFGDPTNPLVEISPVALAMILGVVLNVILRDKKVAKDNLSEDLKDGK